MKSELAEMDLYVVTDRGLSRKGVLSDIACALDAGCRVIQYREKRASTREMAAEAAAIARLCRSRALFLVNDRIDVALAAGADGVHIGQDDMPYELARALLGPGRVIGVTTHDEAESVEAERRGADYIGLSPIFNTATKEDAGEGGGLGLVRRVRAAVSIPIVAIGGIGLENAGQVIAAGADSVAAISALVCAEDVRRRAAEFREVIRSARETRI
jgi:thiamine-phosphate pyrophosphorylase